MTQAKNDKLYYIHICTYVYTGKTVAQCEQLCNDYGPGCKGFEIYSNHGGAGNGLGPGDIYTYIYTNTYMHA